MDELGRCFRCGRVCDAGEHMAAITPIDEWLCTFCAELVAQRMREGNDQR